MTSLRRRLRDGILDATRRLPSPRDEAAVEALRAGKTLLTGRRVTASTRAPSAPRRSTPAPAPTAPAARPHPREALDRAFASGDDDAIRTALAEVHRLRSLAEALATPELFRGRRLSETNGVKSTQYMVDLLPHLQRALAEHPRGQTFSVLDVGPGNGHGTALLAGLYRQGPLGYRLKVTALDIDDRYRHYIAAVSPHVRFVHDDVYVHPEVYDFVVSSHVIEHVPDPVGFTRRLQELARHAVLVAAPYREPTEELTAGHLSVIDEDVVARLAPEQVTIFESVAWGAFKQPPYESVIARLPGLAAP